MVHQKTINKLKRQNLSEVLKNNRHADDTMRRWKDYCNDSIKNLIIFGGMLPNNIQSQAFSFENVTGLISQILYGNNVGLHKYKTEQTKSIYRRDSLHYDVEFNNRITKISAFLAKTGIQVLIRHYERTLSLDPRMHRLIIDPLIDVMTICDTILEPQTRVSSSGTITYNIKHKDKSKKRY